MRRNDDATAVAAAERLADPGCLPIVIATILREDGITGVQTHVRQFRRFLADSGSVATLVTPFSWGGRTLTTGAFGIRLLLARFSGPASVVWYRHWHELFLRNALRRQLAGAGRCVVYAQDPLAARAALRERCGRHQRVIMAVHFRISQADEWADKNLIRRDGSVFRAIRRTEREVIPRVDGLVYVSHWARQALSAWLPEAAAVPSAVIGNFVAPLSVEEAAQPLGDLVTIGNLDLVKNHRFLLDVLAHARRAGRSLTLDVFGEGPCRTDLLRQARSLGLEAQARFHGFRPDAPALLPGYRVYVHASYSESSSFAIIEAMAAGLPIVTADACAIRELCDDGVEGRFWSLDDPARAAATLMQLLDDEPARLKAANAARDRFRRDFDADVVGPQLRSFLLRTASTEPSRSDPSTLGSPV